MCHQPSVENLCFKNKKINKINKSDSLKKPEVDSNMWTVLCVDGAALVLYNPLTQQNDSDCERLFCPHLYSHLAAEVEPTADGVPARETAEKRCL